MLFFFQRERERVQIAGLGCRSLGRGRVRSLRREGGGAGEGEGGEGEGGGRPSSASSTHTRLPIWSGAPRGDFLPLSKQRSCGVCQHLAVIKTDIIAFGSVIGSSNHPPTFF